MVGSEGIWAKGLTLEEVMEILQDRISASQWEMAEMAAKVVADVCKERWNPSGDD